MKYQLISTGRLRAGFKEQESIAQLCQRTKLSEDQVRNSLLNGKPKILLRSDKQEKIQKAALALNKAGLEVKIQASQPPPKKQLSPLDSIAPKKDKEQPEKKQISSLPPSPPPTKKKFRAGRFLLNLFFFLIILVGGAMGYGWYWLHQPLPANVAAAEQALFDGNLFMAGLIDVKKLALLEQHWLGKLDPKTLPVQGRQQDLLNKLLSGAPNFREKLSHILYAASLSPEQNSGQKQGSQLVLLAGTFKAPSLLKTLATSFHIEQTDTHRWQLSPLPVSTANGDCPKKENGQKFYLHISPNWLMLFTDASYADHIWARLTSGQKAQQGLSAWQDYRKGKFISLMVVDPAKTGKAIGGIAGMMIQGVNAQTPQVKRVALGLEAHPLKGGLNTHLHLTSADTAWNAATAARLQQELEKMQKDVRSVTPSMAALLARIKPSGKDDGVDIDVRIDAQLLDDFTQVLQEGFDALFAGFSDGGNNGQGEAEQINETPATYENISLTELPTYTGDTFQSALPLFVDGPFAVDLKSISPGTKGGMKLQIDGKVQLPENTNGSFNRRGIVALQILSVQDDSGQELLRDEHCLTHNELAGQSPNHEAKTSTMHQRNQGRVLQKVRLIPDIFVEKIEKVIGEISFFLPTKIRKFSIPLRAGESVEHGGVRFYLNKITNNSVTYQVSGKKSRLMEIRGLNQAGQVLKQGWMMGNTNNGRATQSFAGQIKRLEIFITENAFEQKKRFELTNLFQEKKTGQDEQKEQAPAWLGPEKISLAEWNAYKKINLKKLQVDPKKDWYLTETSANKPLAEASWPPIRLFISHSPSQWSNNPTAHLYFPQLKDLPGVLSAISYRIDQPSPEDGATIRYQRASYWYKSTSGEVIVKHSVQGKPFALINLPFITGLKENQQLDRLTGELIIRLPQKTRSEEMALDTLWSGQSREGMTVTLTEVARGMFPGFSLKVEGDLEKLVNLHGIGADGTRITASPINFQSGGYWTMTLPFGHGIKDIELIIAEEQKTFRYPFDFKIKYPEKSK